MSTQFGPRRDPEIETQKAVVLQAVRQGISQEAIARNLGISQPTVSRRLNEALRDIVAPEVDELRRIEGDRLDAMTWALWKRCEAGELEAIAMMLKLMDRRAKLFNLDLTPPLPSHAPTYTTINAEQVAVLPPDLMRDIAAVSDRLKLSPGEETDTDHNRQRGTS